MSSAPLTTPLATRGVFQDLSSVMPLLMRRLGGLYTSDVAARRGITKAIDIDRPRDRKSISADTALPRAQQCSAGERKYVRF